LSQDFAKAWPHAPTLTSSASGFPLSFNDISRQRMFNILLQTRANNFASYGFVTMIHAQNHQQIQPWMIHSKGKLTHS
jgi:hypothetical protein